jgi:hypothetical protein
MKNMGLFMSHYVTRNELETHRCRDISFRDDAIQEIRRELETSIDASLAAKDKQIQELRQELASTQLALRQLEHKLSPTIPSTQPQSQISNEAIDAAVHDLLSDPDLNLPFIPDSIEAKIYRKVLQRGLVAFAKMLSRIHLDFLGHELKFILQPYMSQIEENKTLN